MMCEVFVFASGRGHMSSNLDLLECVVVEVVGGFKGNIDTRIKYYL